MVDVTHVVKFPSSNLFGESPAGRAGGPGSSLLPSLALSVAQDESCVSWSKDRFLYFSFARDGHPPGKILNDHYSDSY